MKYNRMRSSSAKNILSRVSPPDPLTSIFCHSPRSWGGAHAFRAYRKTSVDHPSSYLHQAYVDDVINRCDYRIALGRPWTTPGINIALRMSGFKVTCFVPTLPYIAQYNFRADIVQTKGGIQNKNGFWKDLEHAQTTLRKTCKTE